MPKDVDRRHRTNLQQSITYRSAAEIGNMPPSHHHVSSQSLPSHIKPLTHADSKIGPVQAKATLQQMEVSTMMFLRFFSSGSLRLEACLRVCAWGRAATLWCWRHAAKLKRDARLTSDALNVVLLLEVFSLLSNTGTLLRTNRF